MNNKIKSIRVLKMVKQKDMAEQLGMSQQYLSRLESGRIDIKLSTLKRIAEILEVSVTELVN